MEVVCDMVDTFNNLAIITEHFTNKWSQKYKSSKKVIPVEVTDRMIKFDDVSLIWNLSSSRII